MIFVEAHGKVEIAALPKGDGALFALGLGNAAQNAVQIASAFGIASVRKYMNYREFLRRFVDLAASGRKGGFAGTPEVGLLGVTDS